MRRLPAAVVFSSTATATLDAQRRSPSAPLRLALPSTRLLPRPHCSCACGPQSVSSLRSISLHTFFFGPAVHVQAALLALSSLLAVRGVLTANSRGSSHAVMPQHFYPPGERTPPSYDFLSMILCSSIFSAACPFYPAGCSTFTRPARCRPEAGPLRYEPLITCSSRLQRFKINIGKLKTWRGRRRRRPLATGPARRVGRGPK